MSVNVLLEKSDTPTDERLKALLGEAWSRFEALRTLTGACDQEWRHYGKKYGWKLKVHANDKTLLELTVAQGWFLVALAIREKERQALEAEPSLASVEVPAAPAPEGYGIKVEVRDAASFERARALLQFVMSHRKLG